MSTGPRVGAGAGAGLGKGQGQGQGQGFICSHFSGPRDFTKRAYPSLTMRRLGTTTHSMEPSWLYL